MNNLKNMEMAMRITSELKVGKDQTVQNVQSHSKYFRDQPLIYQTSKLENLSGTGKQVSNIEMYVDDQTMYTKDNASGQWTKVNLEQGNDKLLKDSLQKRTDPSAQLATLKTFEKNMKLTENGPDYVVTFGGSWPVYQGGHNEKPELNPGGHTGKCPERHESHFHKYTYVIDRKTYDPKSLDVSFTAESKDKANSGQMKLTIQSDFSNINQLKSPSVPADVKKKAINVDPGILQGQ